MAVNTVIAMRDIPMSLKMMKRYKKPFWIFIKTEIAGAEYKQYKDNLKANVDAVDLAEKSFKQSQDMFASGQISVVDLNNAELLLTKQRLNKEMTLYYINVTMARIEKLVTERYGQ